MRKIIALSFAALALAFGSSAQAETKTHAKAKVSVDVPAGWKMNAPNENEMVILDPKEEVLFDMLVIEGADLQKAVKGLDEYVGQKVQNVKWEDKGKDITLNGMKAYAHDGKGSFQGKPVDLIVLMVATPSKKALLILGVAITASLDAHKGEIKAFLNSIKPAG